MMHKLISSDQKESWTKVYVLRTSSFFFVFCKLDHFPGYCCKGFFLIQNFSWDSNNLLVKVKSESEVTGSCPTLCDLIDCSPPGFSIHEILQAGMLEWVTISFSRGSSRPRDRTQVSRIAGRCFQIRSVAQSCPTICDPMNLSTPGLPVHHQLPEFIQTHIHQVSDAIQPSNPLSSPSPPAPNPSQHQSLFQWVNSSHEVAKVLEFQL